MAEFERGQRITVTVRESGLARERDGGWAGKNGRVLRTEGDRMLVYLGPLYQWEWFYEHELEEWGG